MWLKDLDKTALENLKETKFGLWTHTDSAYCPHLSELNAILTNISLQTGYSLIRGQKALDAELLKKKA